MVLARIREDAAILCSLIACQDLPPPRPCFCIMCIAAEYNDDEDGGAARVLAQRARDHVVRTTGRTRTDANYGELFAHAESLLRTGWTPSKAGR